MPGTNRQYVSADLRCVVIALFSILSFRANSFIVVALFSLACITASKGAPATDAAISLLILPESHPCLLSCHSGGTKEVSDEESHFCHS